MQKKVYFYIDDVIWCLRDITRQTPKSIYDNEFFKGLKEAHDKYGFKVQLNIFNRQDFFYGGDEFCLNDVTDRYKAEFTEASDWLKFGFHAKQEFPDYPYINADYKDVKSDIDYVKREIKRFACEESFAHGCTTHWLPISKDGCRALRDGGITILNSSYGDTAEYEGDPNVLPYGHAGRLLQNRKPETKLFTRQTRDVAIAHSLCGYNHLTNEEGMLCFGNFKTIYNEELGLHLKRFGVGLCLNHCTSDIVKEIAEGLVEKDYEYIGYAVHEQYFYPDYYAYQPDYMEKLHLAAKIFSEAGYEHFFVEELVD